MTLLVCSFTPFKRNPLKEDWKFLRPHQSVDHDLIYFQEKSSKRGLKVFQIIIIRNATIVADRPSSFKRNPLKEDWKLPKLRKFLTRNRIAFKRNPLKEDWKLHCRLEVNMLLVEDFQEKSSKRGLKVSRLLSVALPSNLFFQEKSSKRGLKDLLLLRSFRF